MVHKLLLLTFEAVATLPIFPVGMHALYNMKHHSLGKWTLNELGFILVKGSPIRIPLPTTNIGPAYQMVSRTFWHYESTKLNIVSYIHTVDSGNSERLNSEQSLISEHFGETGRFFYNINYMLNSEHLSLVNKTGDKTEFTITRVHCSKFFLFSNGYFYLFKFFHK